MSEQEQPHPTPAVCRDNGTFVPQSAPVISRVRATEEETAALAAVGQPTEAPRVSPAIRGPFYEPTTGWWDARGQQIEQREPESVTPESEPEPEQPKRTGRRKS